MDARLHLGHGESPSNLEALPDNVFDAVLRRLYQEDWERYNNYHHNEKFEVKKRRLPSSLSALAASTRRLRDVVRRVRSHARYELRGTALCARSIAEHLKVHKSCTSLSVIASPSDKHFSSQVVDLLCHMSSSPSPEVKQLSIWCSDRDPESPSKKGQDQDTANDYSALDEGSDDPDEGCDGPDKGSDGPDEGSDDDDDDKFQLGRLRAKHVVLMAKAFPRLEWLAIFSHIRGSVDLCASLAACCPHLRSLEVYMLNLRAEPLGSLSALRGLTSLVLKEWGEWIDWVDDDRVVPGLLQQLTALSALSHLSLSFQCQLPGGFSGILPPLGHTQLRSLELSDSRLGFFHIDGFPALAAAFPCLEQLSCMSLEDDPEDLGAPNEWYAAAPVRWRLPNLRVVSLDRSSECGFGIDGLLRLAAGCPALRDVCICDPVTLSWKRSRQVQEQGTGQDAAAVALRWLQGLSTTAGHGLLEDAELELEVGSAEEAHGFCTALEQFHPAARRAEAAALIRRLEARGLGDEAPSLGRLVAHLPHLRHVTCDVDALPMVAHVRGLEGMTLCVARPAAEEEEAAAAAEEGAPTAAAKREAVDGFAEWRAAALHPSAVARPAARFEDGLLSAFGMHVPVVSIWDESAGRFEVWEASWGWSADWFKLERQRTP